LLYNPLNTNKSNEFGFNGSGYNNATAAKIPDQNEAAYSDSKSFSGNDRSSYEIDYNADEIIEANKADDELGNVVHAFEPGENKIPTNADSKTPFAVREAWDDTHAIFGTAPFTGLTEDQIKDKIANNGSFNNTAGDQIKKSFTFNMPLNNTVMKSYRNPYSTVISTALPFSKDTGVTFRAGDHYKLDSGNDMNGILKDPNKAGNYTDAGTGTGAGAGAAINPWYGNNDGNGDLTGDGVIDESGYKLNVNTTGPTGHNLLHLNNTTWSQEKLGESENDYYKPGVHNVTSTNSTILAIGEWIKSPISRGSFLAVNRHDLTSALASVDSDVDYNHGDIADASNENGFQVSGIGDFKSKKPVLNGVTGSGSSVPWPDIPYHTDTGGSVSGTTYTYDKKYYVSETHKQLASNIGYILINAVNLSESDTKRLSKYQLPVQQTVTDDELKGIANLGSYYDNSATTSKFLQSRPVNDDLNYRGGLIGTMSINNDKSIDGAGTSADPIKQKLAGSIYNPTLFTDNASISKTLTIPGLENSTVNTELRMTGSKFTDTKLHYGLTWNDSSDLPQVKIKRSLNAQYLVPVSIARDVTTTWTQYNRNGEREWVTSAGTSGGHWNWVRGKNPSYRRQVSTNYHNYSLYLGNVKLSSDKKVIDIDKDSLSGIQPVNNQIKYERMDTSYPHYDSELFDHGSNRKSITATHNHKIDGKFVGNTEEKDTSVSEIPNDKYVGSSDDYSIGIVHAPKDLFYVDREG
ncbi:MAG: hypothetical protein ACRCZW_05670, partial [Lactobacillaceae bacterium]